MAIRFLVHQFRGRREWELGLCKKADTTEWNNNSEVVVTVKNKFDKRSGKSPTNSKSTQIRQIDAFRLGSSGDDNFLDVEQSLI